MLVTFVCTGNTCRSPMAEGLFRKTVKERNIENVECRSCGLSAYSGDCVSDNAVEAARKFGVDISDHRSSVLTQYLIYETDIFVCMTAAHAAELENYICLPNKKIIVLGGGIFDPYGQSQQVYDMCAELVYDGLNCLADALFCDIVPMDESGVNGIYDIENECFSAPWSLDSIKAELDNETAHFLTARSGDKIIGYIGVHEVAGEAYIANLAVSGKYRGYGVADRLMERAESEARERGCVFISLEVRKSNEKAVSLYKKRGYKTVGERKNFYTNPPEDGLIMTLNFE